jgi:hypothetical protein
MVFFSDLSKRLYLCFNGIKIDLLINEFMYFN